MMAMIEFVRRIPFNGYTTAAFVLVQPCLVLDWRVSLFFEGRLLTMGPDHDQGSYIFG